ncbi:MAG: MATE family efflux transporter [Firmicutes bacterium]|jgi:putative MATE family efflux protein|nr:MATE family efflux transporter [Bacillota bacterium]
MKLQHEIIGENKLAVMPIKKLILNISIPIMISMLLQGLYNIIDSLFIARIPLSGEQAINALTLAFPIQMFIVSVCVGTGVGLNAILAKTLGQKNHMKANNVACNGIIIGVITYVFFLLFGVFAIKMYFNTQTNNPLISSMGIKYLTIISVFSFGQIGQLIFERMLQATGKSFYTMITQGTGAIINVILDPILIFGYFKCPALGVAGAAYATVIGQICACGLAIFFNLKFNKEIAINFKAFKTNFKIIKEIYKISLPAIVMLSLTSIMTYGMNIILGIISETAVSAYGLYFRIQSFIFMPVLGLSDGVAPITAYNYGAQNKKRILSTIKFSLIFSTIIMIIGFIVFQIFTSQIISIFNVSGELEKISIIAMKIISVSFVFVGVNFIMQSVFQAIGKGGHSLSISLLRVISILGVASYLIKLHESVKYIWWAIPAAELVTIAGTIYLYRINYIEKIDGIMN